MSERSSAMLIAVTRRVSPNMDACVLSRSERQPIDIERARRQHRAYRDCLARLGCRVVTLPAEPELPDAVFVEDTAVVLDELAVITRPGHPARRGETPSIEAALSEYRPTRHIRAPGTLDGGDVLPVGRTIYAGLSARSNESGISQLREILRPFGYEVKLVRVSGCLHLKSACSCVAPKTLLINREWVAADAFSGLELIDVHPAEPSAANALPVGQTVLFPAAHPLTRAILEKRGFRIETVDASELAKAEGALTCQSLIFRRNARLGGEGSAS
jgi:dimethylargininase